MKTEFQGQDVLPFSETYDRAAVDALLEKAETAGLRIYFGMDESLKVHAIIVAVNGDNGDILPSSLIETVGEDIIDNGNRCPDLCPPPSPLNN